MLAAIGKETEGIVSYLPTLMVRALHYMYCPKTYSAGTFPAKLPNSKNDFLVKMGAVWLPGMCIWNSTHEIS